MTNDTVITVAIGRNGPDGTPMADALWSDFRAVVRADVAYCVDAVVFTGTGTASGSDGTNLHAPEESYAVIGINPHEGMVRMLRIFLADRLVEYRQTSACMAIDGAHEPVWNTADGSRPSGADYTTAALYAPSHGGYPHA